MLDRIDVQIELQAVSAADLSLPPPTEGSAEVAARILAVRDVQAERYKSLGAHGIRLNAHADGDVLERVAQMSDGARQLLMKAAESLRLSARGYHRVLRLARTIADLDGRGDIGETQIAEATSYRRAPLLR